MKSTVNGLEEEFTEAANNWNLERLYIDLATAKEKALTPVEKKILRGLLCGYSPAEIADRVYKATKSSSVRVYLSNGLYKYIQELLSHKTGNSTKIKSWSHVTILLEKAGYKTVNYDSSTISNELLKCNRNESGSEVKEDRRRYWEEDLDVKCFYGRIEELATLEQWILKDNCRLVALLGMGGIGKTFVGMKLAKQIQEEFEFVIWRSLRSTPPLLEILNGWIKWLDNEQQSAIATTVEAGISTLMAYLRSHRCLLILDGVSAVLRSGTLAGYYREGYEEYGELFRRIAEESHHSCLAIASREKPKEVALLEGEKLPVRCLDLAGLQLPAVQELLQDKGVIGSIEECKVLSDRYSGNPLYLKIAATTIQNVFDGNISEFLSQNVLVFGNINDVLSQQFDRLSSIEKKVMYWLTLNCQMILISELQNELVPGISKREQIEAIESLRRRSLLEKNSISFTLPPMLKMHIAERLAEQVNKEISNKEVALVLSHEIIKNLDNSTPTKVRIDRKAISGITPSNEMLTTKRRINC